MNLPNSITMSRIVMIPLLLWILTPHFPWHTHGAQHVRGALHAGLARRARRTGNADAIEQCQDAVAIDLRKGEVAGVGQAVLRIAEIGRASCRERVLRLV